MEYKSQMEEPQGLKGGGERNDEFSYKVVEFEVRLKLSSRCPSGSLNSGSRV